MGFPHLLELAGPSCEACGEVSSADMLSHGSSKGCHLFGHGDCWGTDLEEEAADGCSSTGDVLVGGIGEDDEGDCPNKMWQEVVRFSLRDCGV